MTDAEREGQIRHLVAQVQAMAPYDAENVQGHVTFLLRLLDEARAEITRLTSDEEEALEEEGAVRLSLARKRNEIIADLENEISNLKDEIVRLHAEITSRDTVISEMQRTFDLMWEADQRGIKAWQEANPGNDMVWPDRAEHMQWLLEQIARLQAPPGASAMERAQTIVPHLSQHPDPYTLEEEKFWLARAARAIEQAEAEARAKAIEDAKHRIDNLMNAHLIEMKPDYDDSIVGFNAAWEVVRNAFCALAKPSS